MPLSEDDVLVERFEALPGMWNSKATHLPTRLATVIVATDDAAADRAELVVALEALLDDVEFVKASLSAGATVDEVAAALVRGRGRSAIHAIKALRSGGPLDLGQAKVVVDRNLFPNVRDGAEALRDAAEEALLDEAGQLGQGHASGEVEGSCTTLELAAAFVGKQVTAVYRGLGPSAILVFAAPPDDQGVHRTARADRVPTIEGPWSLLLPCAWELTAPDDGAWPEPTSLKKAGTLALLDRLVGSRVVSAEIAEPSLDLTMGFDNGVSLQVLPDLRPGGGTYTLRAESRRWRPTAIPPDAPER